MSDNEEASKISLLDLPNELMVMIMPYTMPDGIQSLALSCRLIHALSKPFLEEDHELRSNWTDTFIGQAVETNDGWVQIESTLDIVRAIAHNPLISRYIKSLVLTEHGYGVWPTLESRNRSSAAILQLCRTSTALRHAGLDPVRFVDQAFSQEEPDEAGQVIASWDEEASLSSQYSQNATALLLTMLPNVQSIVLPDGWIESEESERLLSSTIFLAHRLRSSSPSLSKLRMLELTRFAQFRHFAKLQSLEKVHISSDRSQETVSRVCDDIATEGNTHSQVRSLHLGFDPEESTIEEVLMLVPNLESLCLESGYDAEISSILRAVQSKVGSRIKKLVLWFLSIGAAGNGPLNFLGFTQLQDLTISMDALACILRQPVTREKLRYSRHLSERFDDQIQTWADGRQTLVDVLPASLVNLKIEKPALEGNYATALAGAFRQFAMKQRHELPSLRLVYLRKCLTKSRPLREEWARIKEQCRELDCRFSTTSPEPRVECGTFADCGELRTHRMN